MLQSPSSIQALPNPSIRICAASTNGGNAFCATFVIKRLRPLHAVAIAVHETQRLECLGNHWVAVAVAGGQVGLSHLAIETAGVLNLDVIDKNVKPSQRMAL